MANRLNKEQRYARCKELKQLLSCKVKSVRKQSPSDIFHHSAPWKKIRAQVLSFYGRICMKCTSTKRIQVDHIKPKSEYPELSLEFSNLQVLCWPCNRQKWVNRDETDYRNC